MKEYFERIRKMDPQDNYVELKVISGSAAGDKALYVNGQRIYAERDFFPLTLSSFDLSGTGILEMGDRLFYHERLCGKKKLVVCGAGHVGLAVARLGRFLEYAMTVIEDREEFAAKAKECGADHVMVCSSFARCLKEEYGFNTYAPYSGTEYDIISGNFIKEGVPIPIKKKESSLVSDVYERLKAAGARLVGIIARSDGLSNKDKAKFADQINALCDKWSK